MEQPTLDELELLAEKVLGLEQVFSEDSGKLGAYFIDSYTDEDKKYVFVWRVDKVSGGYWQVFLPQDYQWQANLLMRKLVLKVPVYVFASNSYCEAFLVDRLEPHEVTCIGKGLYGEAVTKAAIWLVKNEYLDD